MKSNYDYRLLMDTAILAGEIMLRNGAETYRVEDTVSKILQNGKCMHTQVVALTTSISATISNPDMDAITVIRRISERGTNLNKVYLVNNVSRDFCADKINLETTHKQLRNIQTVVEYSTVAKRLATAFVVPLFIMLLGGGYKDMLVGLMNGFLLILVMYLCDKVELNTFVREMIASAFVALFASLISKYIGGVNVEVIITSSIMPIVPGVAITNAIRDTLQGDYMSGVARILEAFAKALSIALGVYAGIVLIV